MSTDRTLVIETATAACSVALFNGTVLVARAHDMVGRGHAERLVPMIAALPGGGRAAHILVDVGPGSFTGIRVGIAAARGLALGWNAEVNGYSALALVAAAALDGTALPELAVVMEGGHGEVFMQRFAAPLRPLDEARSLAPAAALAALGGCAAVGSGLARLAALDPALDPALPPGDALPDAANAMLLPAELRALPPSPRYGRPPDAKLPGA